MKKGRCQQVRFCVKADFNYIIAVSHLRTHFVGIL